MFSIRFDKWSDHPKVWTGKRSQSQEHLNAKDPGQKKLYRELRVKNSGMVEDGISKFDKAIHLRPDYDDALAYMNLMFRERAELECDDPAAQNRDLQTADQWVDKALGAQEG